MKNKKVIYTIIGIVSIALIALAITYAYWQLTKTQQGVNEITAACLDISLVDAESGNAGVTLQEQYPLSDTEGSALKPYKFTVTNNCDTAVDYHVNLEAIGNSATALQASSLKVMLDDNAALLSSKSAATPTINGAYAAHKLGMSSLAAKGETGSSVTHELRLWIDEDAPVSEANNTFAGKISVTIGQGIFASTFKKGSLAYTLVEAAGGEDNVTSISYEKEDRITRTSYSTHIGTETTAYYWGTDYNVDAEGKYSLAGTIVKSSLTDCRNGTNTCGNYTIQFASSETATSTSIIEVTDFKTSGRDVTANIRAYVNDFYYATGDDEAGMYKTQDDYGTSYYYRGNVTNNYVKFGEWQEDTTITYWDWDTDKEKNLEIVAGSPIYWRIVRINGDGTIRMIYDGTEKYENGESRGSFVDLGVYNENAGNKMHVGYMYGTEGDPYGDNVSTTLTNSTIKDTLDTWYETNLKSNYKSYIADSIFCNDREEYTDEDGYVIYKNNNRQNNNLPVLTCSNQRDRFTVDDTTLGNGHLTNPVGLLTAEEAIFAGYATWHDTTNNYLDINNRFWTSSPSSSSDGYVSVFYVGFSNLIDQNTDGSDDGYCGARPVINLKADVEFTIDEDGTYIITTE